MRFAFVGFLLLLPAVPLGAQETHASIHGMVSDSLGRPLAGVTVLVEGSALGIESDAQGAFLVPQLTPGAYRLSFHLDGFVPRTFRFRIPEGYEGRYAVGQIMLQPVGEGFVTLTGTVRDSASQEPVPAVTIGLDERVAAVTDRDGTFQVDRVALGTRHLEARRIGYRPVAMDLDIIAGETFNLDIAAPPLPFPLEILEVGADDNLAAYGTMQGFMRRRRDGRGFSMVRREIEEEHPFYVTDLFRKVPGLRVRYNTRGEPFLVVRGCVGGKRGTPNVYINGIYMDPGAALGGLDNLVHPEDIDAFEVHLGAYTPVEYRNFDGCGVIAIWTR